MKLKKKMLSTEYLDMLVMLVEASVLDLIFKFSEQ